MCGGQTSGENKQGKLFYKYFKKQENLFGLWLMGWAMTWVSIYTIVFG